MLINELDPDPPLMRARWLPDDTLSESSPLPSQTCVGVRLLVRLFQYSPPQVH